MEKWPIFDQNQKHTPFNKSPFFDFFNVLFLQLTETFFTSRISENSTSWPILPKKKRKMAIFGPKPWFKKMSIFRLSELLLCIPYKGVFPFQSMVKGIFLAYVAQKKELEKWPFFDQNHGFTPLEKRSIFRLFELLVFIAQKDIFSFQNIVEDIFLPHIAKKKKDGKMAIFGPKPWVNPF